MITMIDPESMINLNRILMLAMLRLDFQQLLILAQHLLNTI